jgi:hypothetical protein
MAIYSQNVTQSVEPARADISPLLENERLRASVATDAIKGVTGLVKLGYQAYEKSQEVGLKKELKAELDTFGNEMTVLKEADVQNKVMFEQSRSSLPAMAEEFRAGAILAGADPEQARSQSTIFGQKQENTLVTQFRQEQARIVAAREAMPDRYREFMGRSEAKLKEYIAKHPYMANTFRQVATEVTGKANLDLYSVQRLYEDVNFIEKQQEANEKAQAAALDKQRTAYVNDRKGGGVSETQAMAEFNAFDENTRLTLANVSATKAGAKQGADNALKLGGAEISNYVTFKIAESNSTLLEQQGKLIAKLSELGITKAQIVSGTVPDNIKNDPKYIQAMSEAQAGVLTVIESMYAQGLKDLTNQMQSTVADPTATRQARLDWETWYKDQTKTYGSDASSLLFAFAGNDDPTKVVQTRLTLINTFSQTLQLPPEIVQKLLTSDQKTFDTTKTQYPKAVAQLEYLRRLSSAALRGVSNTEWIGLLKQADKYIETGVESIPANDVESTAAFVNIQQGLSALGSAVRTNAPITQDAVYKVVTSSMSTPANAEEFFKSVVTTSQALSKLEPEERQALNERVTNKSRDYVYGEQGFGNRAKNEYSQLNRQDPPPYAKSRNIVFKDTKGLTSLRVDTVVVPQDNITASQRAVLQDRIRADVSATKVNKVLTQVDAVLRIEANVTGKPIAELRTEFMRTFIKEGMPSANITAKTMGAIEQVANQEPTTTGNDATSILNGLKNLGVQ